MKTTNRLINALILIVALDQSELCGRRKRSPQDQTYVTITKMHWNMDYEDFDMDTWKAVEKEYFDKVTNPNELIMGSGIYLHRFTPDNRELLICKCIRFLGRHRCSQQKKWRTDRSRLAR